MAGAGDNGCVYHQLDGSQRLLLDPMTIQMQRLLNRNKEELYMQIVKSSLFTLKPLSPREVCDDQIRVGEKRDASKTMVNESTDLNHQQHPAMKTGQWLSY